VRIEEGEDQYSLNPGRGKVICFVIPNEVRNLSLIEAQEREIPRRQARLGMTKS
jgi:hypothetical protein